MPTGKQIADQARIPLEEHWGYIWSTSGQVWTQAAQDRLAREKADDSNYTLSIQYGPRWIGRRVADCSGLVKWVCSQFGIKMSHSSNSQAKGGYLSKLDVLLGSNAIPVGALVFKLRNGSDFHHVGIYVGDNLVVEARGSKTGVTTSQLGTWTHYGLIKGVDYGTEEDKKEAKEPMGAGKGIVDVPNDGTVNVRAKPSLQGQKITTLREGEQLEVLAVSGDWAKIRYTGEGYVMTRYIREVADHE
jgi:hypothetical protein